MKRIASLFVLVLYLSASIGVSITLHYCGESLADVSILNEASCCCDAEPASNDCCSDEIQSLRIEEAHFKSEHTYSFLLCNIDAIPHPYPLINRKHPSCISFDTPHALPAPPDIQADIPIYKRIHSYLFYS